MATKLEDSLLTAEEVIVILKPKYPSDIIEIEDYTIKKVDEKIGLLGEHGFLTVNFKLKIGENREAINKTDRFFAKIFPENEPAFFAKETGAFAKEIFVYNTFNKMLTSGIDMFLASTAKCYFTKDDTILIFDDLSEQGFQQVDKFNYLNFDSLKVVLHSLAKLHAASLIYEEKISERLGKPYRISEDHHILLEDTFFNDREDFINRKGVDASIKAILKEIDLFEQPNKLSSGKDFKEIAEELFYKVYKLVKPSRKFRNVICHGDLWNTNFLFKFNNSKVPVDCKFVDFQSARYLPPAHDVLSVIYLTTTIEFRRKHLYELLGLYYTSLEKIMKLNGYKLLDLIPFSEFMNSCEEQKLFAVIQAANYFQLILVDPLVLDGYFKDKELYQKVFFEDRSYLIMDYVDKDERYKQRLEQTIVDFRMYCEHYSR